MRWGEFAVVVFTVIMAVMVVAAQRVRATDHRVLRLCFGLSRAENGRRGVLVGLLGAAVICAFDWTFPIAYPLIAVGWAAAMAFFWWQSIGERGRERLLQKVGPPTRHTDKPGTSHRDR